MTLIEMKDVSKSYKGLVLFENTDLSIEKGKFTDWLAQMDPVNRFCSK